MSEIQNAIEVKNLKKGFGGRVLFENFSLNVKANTIHAIIGPNGSGKTTLLRLITGVYQPNAGTINIAGKYAMQLENDYLYEEQTGLENLKIFGKYFGFEINDRSDGYCTQLGLTEHLGKRVSTYSKGISICRYVSNETEFWNILSVDEWDIVLLDVNLREQSKSSGIDLIETIYSKKPKIKVVMLSSYDMPVYRQEALKKGAVSYIDKSASADELVKKLTAISKGHKSTTPPLLDPLTDREAEIIKAIGTGKTKHEIAQELYISERTLYNHIQSIYDKLGAKNAIEAYNKAIALGYITPLI